MKRVGVFCGSSSGTDPAFAAAARELGTTLARNGLGLVYGAGKVGLMGILADAALEAGGEVLGVIPQFLVERELAHRGIAELRIVQTMHERKALMADLSDAFIALPGGLGTLDEFCEIVTWAQLGLHSKPCGLLNVSGYFDAFLQQLDRAVADQLVRAEHRNFVLVDDNCAALLERLKSSHSPRVDKWIGQEVR